MQHVPHPLRTHNLWVDRLQYQMSRIGGRPSSKHMKDMAIVMPDPALEIFYQRAAKIMEPFCPCIYDASALIPKLQDQDISNFSLVDVVTPHGIAYYDFGRQERFRLTGHDNTYIEGAYVTQWENDDELSEFVVMLVCNDPDYGIDRSIVDGVRRNADGIWLPIKAHQKVRDAVNLVGVKITQRDSYFIGNDEVCRVAFNEVAKTMCYLASREPDVEFVYQDGADPDLRKLAKAGDREARDHLLSQGFPMIYEVGRHIRKVDQLEQPDFDVLAVGGWGV